jgi:mannose-1-phosphate guanylyltransferase
LTLGIKPDRPETGYGYIQADRKKASTGVENLHKVKTFTEKPNIELARVFLQTGISSGTQAYLYGTSNR